MYDVREKIKSMFAYLSCLLHISITWYEWTNQRFPITRRSVGRAWTIDWRQVLIFLFLSPRAPRSCLALRARLNKRLLCRLNWACVWLESLSQFQRKSANVCSRTKSFILFLLRASAKSHESLVSLLSLVAEYARRQEYFMVHCHCQRDVTWRDAAWPREVWSIVLGALNSSIDVKSKGSYLVFLSVVLCRFFSLPLRNVLNAFWGDDHVI